MARTSNAKDIAANCVALACAAFGLGAGAAIPVSLAALGGIGWGAFRDHRRPCEAAVAAVLKSMPESELSSQVRAEIGEILATETPTVSLGRGDLPAPDAPDFHACHLDMVMRLVPATASNDARSVLRIALGHAIEACRTHPAMHKIVTQETLQALRGDLFKLRRAFEEEVGRAEERHFDTRTDAANTHRKLDSLQAAFEGLTRATHDQLVALAVAFEIDGLRTLSDGQLRVAFEKRAVEYHALKADVEAIDERTKGSGNLKAAARDAIARIDLEEVEHLLAMVQATELDIAAQTANLRADNALLRGRVDQAYDILMASADSFGAMGRERWVRLDRAQNRLWKHGLKFADGGMQRARDANLRALDATEPRTEDWAGTQNNLGNALLNLGERGDDDALRRAMHVFEAALEVRTRDALPVDWAMTRENMANLFLTLSDRPGEDWQRRLTDGLLAVDNALTVYTPEAMPYDYGTATRLRDRILAARDS